MHKPPSSIKYHTKRQQYNHIKQDPRIHKSNKLFNPIYIQRIQKF